MLQLKDVAMRWNNVSSATGFWEALILFLVSENCYAETCYSGACKVESPDNY